MAVHFTDLQKAVIAKVCNQKETSNSSSGTTEDSEISLTDSKHGQVLKLTYPYQKLELVPTRLSTAASKKHSKKKWFWTIAALSSGAHHQITSFWPL